jgi:manganese oxidase
MRVSPILKTLVLAVVLASTPIVLNAQTATKQNSGKPPAESAAPPIVDKIDAATAQRIESNVPNGLETSTEEHRSDVNSENPAAAPADPNPAPAATCARTIKANVVAFDQPYMLNRLGASRPGGMIYALRSDTQLIVPGYGYTAGNIQLKPYKRARPIVLRANVGDCLQIYFTNYLKAPKDGNLYLPPTTTPPPASANVNPDLAPATLTAGIHVNGMQMVDNIASDSSFVGANNNSLVPPNQSKTYNLLATAEGTYLLYSMGAPMRTGQITAGLFGAINVQPKGAVWYRSQVTQQDLDLARDRTKGANGFTTLGQPIINYNAVYPPGNPRAGKPILKMLDGNNNLVHTDLTALIAGPESNGFLFQDNGEGVFRPNPSYSGKTDPPSTPPYPPRIQPYREFTIIYHESTAAVQAFPIYYDKSMEDTLLEARDMFAINYGIGGIGSEILANRINVGPTAQCADCKFEEFFLSSWAVGDPAMVVDVPANVPVGSTDLTGTDPRKISKTTDQLIQQAYVQPPPAINAPVAKPKATKAFYPDDPSNVYHSYIGDHTKFRILHAGTGVTHVHHLHAHQWLHTPNDDNSTYLDSQMLNPGAAYTLEIDYNGGGNKNQTVGDAIFHCHFYPHFAAGMWALWRVHDVFEAGTELGAEGRPTDGSRALPDGEIRRGTPIPALVPIPTNAMAPIPAKVKIVPVCDIGVSDVDCATSASSDRKLVIGYRSQVQEPNKNPGYPFFIPAVAGGRAPHPPLDFANDGSELNGGLPRHLVVSSTTAKPQGKDPSGEIENEQHTRWDFTKDLKRLAAFKLPEDGTPLEKVAMAYHQVCKHPSFTPLNAPKDFQTNGLKPQRGAPYADPATDGDCISVLDTGRSKLRTYKAANVQLDVVFNKAGWHFPQQRMLTLWQDVAPTVSGTRPPEPFFFRANSGDVIEYWHTNLVPNYYELDDFQVRTPTDILGQHIHLVKFDVTSSDGSGNGFNYEDGTFSPDEVRDLIKWINVTNGLTGGKGLFDFDPVTQWANKNLQTLLSATPPPTDITSGLSDPGHYNDCSNPGDPTRGIWCGAQTTVQRWYADPLLNLASDATTLGKDRTIRTVFTHDHFGPSTHQQVGLYAALVVEPKDSTWKEPQTGTVMGTRTDGGPTSWQANIETSNVADSYREFLFEIQDMALAYGPQSINKSQFIPYPCIGKTTAQCNPATRWGWTDTTNAINPLPPSNTAPGLFPVSIISGNIMGTQSVNYRNEPLPNRVVATTGPNQNQLANGEAGSLSHVFRSIPRPDTPLFNVQPSGGSRINPGCTITGKPWDANWPCFVYPTNPLTGGMGATDPFTPLARVYEGDKVQVRVLPGAHMSPHYFTLNGLNWLFEPGTPNDPNAKTQNNSGYRSTQPMGISEHWEMLFTTPVAVTGTNKPQADYLYTGNALQVGLQNGMWGLLRAYATAQPDLVALPNNAPGNKTAMSDGCPAYATKTRSYDVTATTAQQALPGGTLVYNNRPSGSPTLPPIADPNAMLYILTDDLDENGKLKTGIKPEPLVLRAAAGECVAVTLRNTLDPSSTALSKDTEAVQPFGNCINCTPFVGWKLRPPGTVGLHPQLLSYNVTVSDGMNVGLNPVQTAKATLSNQPPNVVKYFWYAGNPPTADNPSATPIEFGAVGLFAADPLLQHQTGLVGALVVEPKGSSWMCDGGVKCDGTSNGTKVPISYASATVTKSDGSTFREFVVVTQDDANITGAAGINYKTEPISLRFTAPPSILSASSQQRCANNNPPPPGSGLDLNNCPDMWLSFSDKLVMSDPQTPVFTANAGQPARFRLVQPGGSTNGQVFTLHGHVWQEEPYRNASTEIGNNPLSQWLGSRDSYGAASHYDIVLDKAGGEGAVPGDYLYRTYVGNQITKGLWGIFRVASACGDPNAPNCPDTVVITSYTKQGGNITVSGTNTVDPKTGLYAPTVNICAGKVDTCAEGSAAFLHKQPVDSKNGTWQFTGPKSPAPTQVTAVSAFGGIYTYSPFATPPAQPKAPLKPNPEYKNSNTDRFEQRPANKKP